MKLLKCNMIILLAALFLCGCHDIQPIENLAVITGFGYDIDKEEKINGKPKFVSAIEYISIKEKEKAGTDYYCGKGGSIYKSIEDYKLKQGNPFRYGSELVYLISEERAKFGIDDIVYDLTSYPDINVNANVIVCKDKCEDYFSLKQDSGSTSEKLSDMIKFSDEKYFYSNFYTVNDFLCMYYQKGRTLLVPYVEIKNKNLKLAGFAVFKENKLYKVLPIKDAKLINILRKSGNSGIITVHSDKPLEYLEMEAKNKVKVKVSKEEDKLKYDIFVKIKGDLTINTIKNKELNKKEIKKLEKKFEKQIKKDLDKEVKKVQNEYGIDVFDITKYALAEYGQNSKYNKNKYFSEADINIHVKVKMEYIGKIQDVKIKK